MSAPRIVDYYNSLLTDLDLWYLPQNGSKLLVFDPICGGGGGGGGTDAVKPGSIVNGEFVHPRYALYGKRAGDTLLLMRSPVPATLVRGPVTRLEFSSPHGMVRGQPCFIIDAIPGYKDEELQSPFTRYVDSSYQFTTFYSRYMENWSETGFELCREPYNAPFSYEVFLPGYRDIYYPDLSLPFQRPIAMTGGNLSVMVWTSWYGFPGGAGGGEVGDNGGCGGSPHGTTSPGPDGYVQSFHLYGGSSDVMWNGGGRGAAGPYGGSAGSQCSFTGNAGADGTGAGGGGAAPGVVPGDGRMPHDPGCWGMGGGGPGIGGKVWFKPKPVNPADPEGSMQPIWCRAGKRGIGGNAGTHGYAGGNGSLGRVTIQDWK